MEAELPPEIEAVYNQLITDINAEVKELQARIVNSYHDIIKKTISNLEINSNPAPTPQKQTLPWFGHGIKGAVRKLWYGDSKENPSWKEHNVSLSLYNTIKESLYEPINVLMEGEEEDIRVLIPAFNDFHQKIASMVKNALLKSQAIYKGNPQDASAATVDNDKANSGNPIEKPEENVNPVTALIVKIKTQYATDKQRREIYSSWITSYPKDRSLEEQIKIVKEAIKFWDERKNKGEDVAELRDVQALLNKSTNGETQKYMIKRNDIDQARNWMNKVFNSVSAASSQDNILLVWPQHKMKQFGSNLHPKNESFINEFLAEFGVEGKTTYYKNLLEAGISA